MGISHCGGRASSAFGKGPILTKGARTMRARENAPESRVTSGKSVWTERAVVGRRIYSSYRRKLACGYWLHHSAHCRLPGVLPAADRLGQLQLVLHMAVYGLVEAVMLSVRHSNRGRRRHHHRRDCPAGRWACLGDFSGWTRFGRRKLAHFCAAALKSVLFKSRT